MSINPSVDNATTAQAFAILTGIETGQFDRFLHRFRGAINIRTQTPEYLASLLASQEDTCYECGKGVSVGVGVSSSGKIWRHMDCPAPPTDAPSTSSKHCWLTQPHAPHTYYRAKQITRCEG